MPTLMHRIIAAVKQIYAVLKYPRKPDMVDSGVQNGDTHECLSP